MTEEEKRRQRATNFAATQERASASKVQGAPSSASRLGRKEYSAGADSPLRQEATRLDGSARSLGQSANNRPSGDSLIQSSATTPTASRNVAQTVSDFTAGSIDDNIIYDQLDGAQDDEKDLFDDIFGLDEEEEDEFNPNYLA